jgi:hypothetical protein
MLPLKSGRFGALDTQIGSGRTTDARECGCIEVCSQRFSTMPPVLRAQPQSIVESVRRTQSAASGRRSGPLPSLRINPECFRNRHLSAQMKDGDRRSSWVPGRQSGKEATVPRTIEREVSRLNLSSQAPRSHRPAPWGMNRRRGRRETESSLRLGSGGTGCDIRGRMNFSGVRS